MSIMRVVEFEAQIGTAAETILPQIYPGAVNAYTMANSGRINKFGFGSANCQYARIVRSGHPGEDIYLAALQSSGADMAAQYDFLANGCPIEVQQGETITVYGYQDSGGNEIIQALMEIEEGAQGVNVKGSRILGSAAWVASTLTASGVIQGTLNPNANYTVLGAYGHSTTLLALVVERGPDAQALFPGHTDVGLGGDAQAFWASAGARAKLTGKGNDLWAMRGLATAADAANTQFLYVLWLVA